MSLCPAVAGVIVVCLFHLRARGKPFLLGDVVVRYGHCLVAYDAYPLVVIDIVDRLSDEESVVGQVCTRTIDFEDLVVVVCQGERSLPTPAVDVHIDGLQSDFDTTVQHRAYICYYRLSACLERQLNRVEQVARYLVVEIESTCDTVAQETEIHTCVPLTAGLPSKVLIHNGVRVVTRAVRTAERIVHGACHTLLGSVVADTRVVTRHTVTESPFEVGEPSGILHPTLLRHTPCNGCRWEPPPLVSLGEFARTVGTHRSGDHIASGIRVVGTQGERHHRVLCVTVGAIACVVSTRSEVVPQCAVHNARVF